MTQPWNWRDYLLEGGCDIWVPADCYERLQRGETSEAWVFFYAREGGHRALRVRGRVGRVAVVNGVAVFSPFGVPAWIAGRYAYLGWQYGFIYRVPVAFRLPIRYEREE